MINALLRITSRIATSRLAGEGAWIACGQVGTAIGVLFLTRLLTGLYPPALFGTANLYLGISTFVFSIFCAPLMWAILRFYPEYVRTGEIPILQCIINRALILTTLPLIGVLLLCGALYSVKAHAPFVLFAILAGLLIVDVIKSNEISYLSAARRQRPNALWMFADACARPLGAIIFGYYLSTTTQSLLLGYLVGSVSVLLFFLLTVKPVSQTATSHSPVTILNMEQALRNYVLPLIPLAVLTGITSLSDRYIIGGILGVEQAGIYVAAYGLVGRPFLMAGIVIEQTIRPRYFDDISAGNFGLGKKIINRWLLTTSLVSLLGVLLVVVFKDDIARLLLGEKYRTSAALMPWIAAGHALLVVSYVFEIVCYAHKQTRAILFVRLAGVLACIVLSIPLIYVYGLRGAAVSVPLYFGFQLLAAFITASKISHGVKFG
jgi:O-antigen/teichoic acid export membrane protein